MTLFDGKPLTEREVLLRAICVCGETYGQHRGGTNCARCPCEQFTERDQNGEPEWAR